MPHATAYLRDPDAHDLGPMVVLGGGSRYLMRAVLAVVRRTVLGEDADDFGETRFAGKEAELAAVLDELAMVSMWGDRRLVVVDDADDFVSRHRGELEKYLELPARRSVLVLACQSWRKNTRLHKALDDRGLVLECDELTGGKLQKWLGELARDRFGKQLARDAGTLLVELAGPDLGLLDQELGKLTAYVGERKRIEADDVRAVVGGWRAETTWVMLDALQGGHVDVALAQLDMLLRSNEAPQRILGGVVFALRRLAKAVRLTARRVPLRDALREAGLYRPSDAELAERYLRRVGRAHAERFSQVLVEADGDMKGGSPLPERAQLERLLVELAGPPVPAGGS